MNMIERARQLRKIIETLSASLPDDQALSNIELFPNWKENNSYVIGDRVRYGDTLYKCVQVHTSANQWNPADAISLWTRVLIPEPEIIPEWEQPISTNPYMKDDKVRHNGKIWISVIDYNVYEPGVVGWMEVTE